VLSDVPTIGEFEIVFGNVVNILLGVAGIALFIMLLMGGFKFLTSGGDPKAIEEAKKTLTYAIAGVVLVVLSFIILRIIEALTGAPVTEFEIIQ